MQDDGSPPEQTQMAGARKAPRWKRRLSTSILLLTMLSVMVAEVLIFVPSIANFRQDWLGQKIEAAAVAGLSSGQAGVADGPLLQPEQEANLLRALGAELIALTSGDVSRLLAKAEDLSMVDRQVDLSDTNPAALIGGAFDTLFNGGARTIRVFGPVGDGSIVAEIVMPDAALREAMLTYSRNILFLSLGIASFAALLVFAAINLFLIRPIERMTRSMISFGEKPDDPARIIVPSRRNDEIGIAETELSAMQGRLAGTLREQRHLADLGLAVSKINHDLRNILASAQMISDRLSDLPDPRVQRFAPMLIRSLDRALTYTQSVLAYGRAVETPPVKRKVRLRRLVEDVYEVLAVAPDAAIDFVNSVPEDFEIEVDPDQFFRVLNNLCRNAVQALEGGDGEAIVRRLAVGAVTDNNGEILILIEDTGPGLPEKARENLFQAFKGSARSGGTGLGLAIAAEIVQAHSGRIALAEPSSPGARFEIRLPGRRPAAANRNREKAA